MTLCDLEKNHPSLLLVKNKFGRLDGRGVWGRKDACILMAESLFYPSETITTLIFSSVAVRSLSCIQLFETPRTAAGQVPLSSTIFQSLLKIHIH